MTSASQDILAAALLLPDADRLDIAQQLWSSVKPPGLMSMDDPESLAELKRRCESADENDVVEMSADEFIQHLRDRLAERKTK